MNGESRDALRDGSFLADCPILLVVYRVLLVNITEISPKFVKSEGLLLQPSEAIVRRLKHSI